MILFPAIDLKDGACVRLLRGEMAAATVFANDPTAPAKDFIAQGCTWLHVVDLNGAFVGAPVNGKAVEAILAHATVKVQLGGGIRDIATLEMWLEKGVTRVVLGTAAVRDPEFVRDACRRHPGRVAVGIDSRKGMVAVAGWAETTEIAACTLADRFADAGVAAIIYTDIDRDGAMGGPNIQATADLARHTPIPVIASGGVSSLDDLRALRNSGAPLEGAISGRALYDGRIDVRAGIAVLKGEA